MAIGRERGWHSEELKCTCRGGLSVALRPERVAIRLLRLLPGHGAQLESALINSRCPRETSDRCALVPATFLHVCDPDSLQLFRPALRVGNQVVQGRRGGTHVGPLYDAIMGSSRFFGTAFHRVRYTFDISKNISHISGPSSAQRIRSKGADASRHISVDSWWARPRPKLLGTHQLL